MVKIKHNQTNNLTMSDLSLRFLPIFTQDYSVTEKNCLDPELVLLGKKGTKPFYLIKA